MTSDIVPGGSFPDYELTGHDRRAHRLSEEQGPDPMILILSRGHYCPKDFQQDRLMVDFEPQVEVAYTKLVTISTSKLSETDESRKSLGAHGSSSPILSGLFRRTSISRSTLTPSMTR